MFQRTLLALSVVLAASAIGCSGSPSDAADDDMELASGAASAVSVKLQGKHKSPKSSAPITTSVFAATTKEGDLFASQPAILAALSPNPDNFRLTLTPGTYDIALSSGQYLIVGEFDRSTRDLWIERRLSISGNKISMSALDTLNPPSSQSEPVLQTSDVLFIATNILTGPVKYEFKDSKTVRVTVPAYKSGITF